MDVLVGMNYAAYHPQKIEASEQLVLYGNKFGVCLGGSHPCLRNSAQILVSNVRVNHVIGYSVSNYFDIESLGVQSEKEEERDCRLEGFDNCSLREMRVEVN